MVRIGELLLEHGWVDATNLRRALSEQALAGGKRICSLLIARGLLDPDSAARALAEQHEVPAALQHHLEHRDQKLAALLPAAVARAHFALPIGRTRGGDLIVCVRDPSPDVQAAIRRVIEETVVFAVTPASALELLLDQSYDWGGEAEFDVDLSTGTQLEPVPGNPSLDADTLSMPEFGELSLVGLDDVRVNKDMSVSHADYKLPQRTTPPPFNAVMPPFGSLTPPTQPPGQVPEPPTQPPTQRMTLPPRSTPPPFAAVSPFATLTPPPPPPPLIQPELEPEDMIDELEQAMEPEPVRPSVVSKPSITTPPATRSAPVPSYMPEMRSAPKIDIPRIGEPLPVRATGTVRSTSPIPMVRLTLSEIEAAIADAVNRDIATDIAMRFAVQRWSSSLLLAVKEGAALGYRGHGTQLSPETVRAIAIPLTTPSIVKAAHDTKKIVTQTPAGAGAIHERLVRMLGQPRSAIAAPIVVAGRIACVFAVGDLNGSGDSASDLERLTTALGDGYTRILRDMK